MRLETLRHWQQEYIGFPAPLRAVQTALVELTFLPLQGGDTEIVLQEGYIYSPGRGENAISTANLGNLHLTISGIVYIDGKMHGDVDFKNVSKKVSFITPTPGGIGPITVAKLLLNTVICAQNF